MTPLRSLEITLFGETYEITSSFLDRYNKPGPRYTSYPTAPEWNEAFGEEDFLELCREADRRKRPVSLYIHLPFCERLCLFCGCNVVIKKDHSVTRPYLERLKAEIDRVAEEIDPSRPVIQIHLGGGTPTYLSADELTELYRHLQKHFTIAVDAEISIEVDPRVTTREQIERLRALGFNRISMGIQDFDPKVQETVRRIQPYELTRDLIEISREVGFPSVNIDLIYGLPYQTVDSFRKTLDLIVGLSPDRIALFSYAHVPWMKKQQKSLGRHLPEGMEKFRIFREGIETFTRAGYRYIGMDHFARPDDELCRAQDERTLHRNFQGYTTKAGADLYGLGVSSISGIADGYAQNHRALPDYAEAIDRGGLAIMRGCRLSADDRLRREVIGRILCHAFLPFAEVEADFGIDFHEVFERELTALRPLADDGLVTLTDERLTVTPLGRIFIRNIAMVFDRYLQEKKLDRPLFSKTL